MIVTFAGCVRLRDHQVGLASTVVSLPLKTVSVAFTTFASFFVAGPGVGRVTADYLLDFSSIDLVVESATARATIGLAVETSFEVAKGCSTGHATGPGCSVGSERPTDCCSCWGCFGLVVPGSVGSNLGLQSSM